MSACSVLTYSLQACGLQLTQLPCLWNFPGKNTGVGCHFLLQGIFLTQRSNTHLLCLPHWQADSLPLHPLGVPFKLQSDGLILLASLKFTASSGNGLEVPSSPCPHPVPSALMPSTWGRPGTRLCVGQRTETAAGQLPPAEMALELQGGRLTCHSEVFSTVCILS